MAEDEKPTESTAKPVATGSGDRRRAARIATFVAVPVTVLAMFGALQLLGSMGSAATDAKPSSESDEPVEVAAPDLADDAFAKCRALITELPDPLGELPRRVVSGDNGAPEIAGAWGDPAAKLRCGVEPVTVPDDGEVFRLGATCWYADKAKKSITWTTVDRELPVELTVPKKYTESGQLAQALSKPVDDKIDPIEKTPTGCSA